MDDAQQVAEIFNNWKNNDCVRDAVIRYTGPSLESPAVHYTGYESRGSEKKTVEGGGSGGCFIATAAYGSPLAAELDILRKWRDEELVPTSVGKYFVDIYYKISPPIADFISKSERLRSGARAVISPFVRFLKSKYG